MFVQLFSDIIYFLLLERSFYFFPHNDKLIKDNSYLIEGHSINRGCDNLCYYKMTKHRIECCNWIYEDMLDLCHSYVQTTFKLIFCKQIFHQNVGIPMGTTLMVYTHVYLITDLFFSIRLYKIIAQLQKDLSKHFHFYAPIFSGFHSLTVRSFPCP